MSKQVIQKLIAAAGIASRRQAEALIKGGNVRVNGQIAKLGDRAEETDDIRLRGKKLAFTSRFVYIKLNKPVGYVSTTRSFTGEKNVFELVKIKVPLTIVGRLDKDSEGLLLLTNDGELANRLMHPKYEVEKVYVVTLGHDIDSAQAEEIIRRCTEGIEIGHGDGIAKAERIKHLRGRTFEVTLRQGKKRQIRRMFRRLGCHVIRLERVRIANVTIGRLRKGQWVFLKKEEVEKLKANPRSGEDKPKPKIKR